MGLYTCWNYTSATIGFAPRPSNDQLRDSSRDCFLPLHSAFGLKYEMSQKGKDRRPESELDQDKIRKLEKNRKITDKKKSEHKGNAMKDKM